MRTSRWRSLAHGLAAASLCLVAVGCGDDTGSDDMAQDLGMRDLTAGDDMAVDMTAPAPPSGAVIVADVVGNNTSTAPTVAKRSSAPAAPSFSPTGSSPRRTSRRRADRTVTSPT
jgi:hypothetical protein